MPGDLNAMIGIWGKEHARINLVCSGKLLVTDIHQFSAALIPLIDFELFQRKYQWR